MSNTNASAKTIKYTSGKTFMPIFIPKTWKGLTDVTGSYVWTDGEDIYYSNGSSHYVLNKETDTWETKTWNGLTSFYGNGIWTDGEDIYYEFSYKLNKETDTWEEMTWYGLTNLDEKYVEVETGESITQYIWTDGENIYFSYYHYHYKLNKETDTWEETTFGGVFQNYSSIGAGLVINGIVYDSSDGYIYRVEADHLIPIVRDSSIDIAGASIWTDGENIYYSNGSSHYVLEFGKETFAKTKKTWNGLTSFYGNYTWTDGEDIYYSNGSSHYVLNKETDTWETKTWNGLTSFYGNYTWTDGEDIYYSNGSSHYVLNKETDTWETKTWNGLPSNYDGLYGSNVWTDGANIYHSSFSSDYYQYKLNKETDTWEKITWNGEINPSGASIWTDGENIYYSNGSSHYKLNKETDTWEKITLYGADRFSGNMVWSDGSNYYVSRSSSHENYIIKSGGTSNISSNLTPGGYRVWTDGTQCYASPKTYDYSLGKWVSVAFKGLLYPASNAAYMVPNIWTDGENIYYSCGSYGSYMLLPSDTKCYQKTANGWVEIIDLADLSEVTLITKSVTENGTYTASTDNADGYSSVTVNVPDSPLPIEVATESEMVALLETASIGAIYKYTGTSGTYEQNALYIVARE